MHKVSRGRADSETQKASKMVFRSGSGFLVVPTLCIDALGPEGSDGESYLQMMRSNVSKNVESLQ